MRFSNKMGIKQNFAIGLSNTWNGYYYTAYKGWDITSYSGLFCPSNKPSYDRLPVDMQLVKTSGWKMFVVKICHI